MTKVIACIATVSFLVVMIKIARTIRQDNNNRERLERIKRDNLREAIDTLNDDGNDYKVGYLIRMNDGKMMVYKGDGEWEIV